MRRSQRQRIMQRKQRIISNIALICIIAALSLLLYRAIGLFNQLKGEMQIDNLYNMQEPTHSFEPVQPHSVELLQQEITQTEELTVIPQFISLHNENSDTVGWLKLDNTRIDHVVVQGDNNVYYLEHDFFGNKSASATMMMDTQCNIEDMKYHYVVYGHRMKSGTMMNDILKYEDKDFFKANPIIHFNTIYNSMEWEVFSTYCKDYNYDNTRINFSTDVEWLEYIRRLQNQSIYQNDIELRIDDVILTLYTCDYRIAGGRYVLHARLIKD